MLSPIDESFGHHTGVPGGTFEDLSPMWAERCYHLLHATPEITLSTGRAMHPARGSRSAFVGLTSGETQHVLRVERPHGPGDDPDRPDVGPIRIEVIEPLERVRLVFDGDRASPFSFDLTYEYRVEPVLTQRNRIEIEGVVVTDYVNFFASGRYTGTIDVDGRTVAVDAFGFRDRGWGLRKHEGAPRRGFVMGMFTEFDDECIYALLYETGSTRRVFSNGWVLRPEHPAQIVESIEHDLVIRDGLLRGGQVVLNVGGRRRTLDLTVENRVFLSPLGYAPGEPPSELGAPMVFDQRDPAVRTQLQGQTDHGIVVTCEGRRGGGYIEVGLGEHRRYSPDGTSFLAPRRHA